MSNLDAKTVSGFGDEWTRFDQSNLPADEYEKLFQSYFDIFPWTQLPAHAAGFDLGCGSGRWAKKVAPRVGQLHLVDASEQALAVARKNLSSNQNCHFHLASVDTIPLADNSMDFGYSLGVLHHVPDTALGLKACVQKLKPGAPFLLYLYYALDNRPLWFRTIWQITNYIRMFVSRLPHSLRFMVSQVLAALIYWPLARLAWLLEKMHLPYEMVPLSFYRNKSFYTMRTDALDRFGTRLEQRFTRQEIHSMMSAAGLHHIHFREAPPYWVALGVK